MQDKEKQKLIKLAELADRGELAIIEYLFEIEQKIEEEIPSIKNVIEKVKGEKGDSYVLTKQDKQQIAQLANELVKREEIASEVISLIDFNKIEKKVLDNIVVPEPKSPDIKKIQQNVEQNVLKQIKIPKPKDGKDADETKIKLSVEQSLTKELPQFGEQFRDGLELLSGDDRLDVSAIRGIKDLIKSTTPKKIGGGSTARNLYQLLDVDISGIQDNQVIKWDATNKKWIPTSSATEISIGDTINSGTANRILYEDTNHKIAESDNLQFDGTDLIVGGSGTFNGTASGQSVFEYGLIINENGDATSTGSFRVESGSYTEAIYLNATTDTLSLNGEKLEVKSPAFFDERIHLLDEDTSDYGYIKLEDNAVSYHKNDDTLSDLRMNVGIFEGVLYAGSNATHNSQFYTGLTVNTNQLATGYGNFTASTGNYYNAIYLNSASDTLNINLDVNDFTLTNSPDGTVDNAVATVKYVDDNNLIGKTLYVDGVNGDDTTGERGTTNAYKTIGGAITDALSGDLVYIYPSTYTERLALKNGVNLHFANGAILTYSANNEPLIYDTAYAKVRITGSGVFSHTGASGGSEDIEITHGSELYIEGKTISSTNGRCVAVYDTNGTGAKITTNFELYDSGDGTIDNVATTSEVNVYGNKLYSDGYVLENDGGTINCWASYIESANDNPVERASDGTINIYGTYIKAPTGQYAVVNSGSQTDILLSGVTLESTHTNAVANNAYTGSYAHNKTGVYTFHENSSSATFDGAFTIISGNENALVIDPDLYNYKLGDIDAGESGTYLEIDSPNATTTLYNSSLSVSGNITGNNLSGTNTGDQDLSAYALKSNVLELDNTTAFTPNADYEPATKKYVDDNAGGGGSPGGANTNVQFNDSGSFGGSSDFSWDKTNKTLTVGKAILNQTSTNQIGYEYSVSSASTMYAVKADLTESGGSSSTDLYGFSCDMTKTSNYIEMYGNNINMNASGNGAILANKNTLTTSGGTLKGFDFTLNHSGSIAGSVYGFDVKITADNSVNYISGVNVLLDGTSNAPSATSLILSNRVETDNRKLFSGQIDDKHDSIGMQLTVSPSNIANDIKGIKLYVTDLGSKSGGPVNNPTDTKIALYIDNEMSGTDLHNKIWAFYNASTTSTGGKMFMGIDNVKSYYGTGIDASLYYDGTDFVIATAEVGSGALKTTAGRKVNTTRVTTTYTISVKDHHIYCDTDGGAFTVTLPTGSDGQEFVIINTGSNDLTITSTENIRGSSNDLILASGSSENLVFETTEKWW